MIAYTCECGLHYKYMAEIVQFGGDVKENLGSLTFICRCGARIKEKQLLDTNPGYTYVRKLSKYISELLKKREWGY